MTVTLSPWAQLIADIHSVLAMNPAPRKVKLHGGAIVTVKCVQSCAPPSARRTLRDQIEWFERECKLNGLYPIYLPDEYQWKVVLPAKKGNSS